MSQNVFTVPIYFNLPQIPKALFKDTAFRLNSDILVAYTEEKKAHLFFSS